MENQEPAQSIKVCIHLESRQAATGKGSIDRLNSSYSEDCLTWNELRILPVKSGLITERYWAGLCKAQSVLDVGVSDCQSGRLRSFASFRLTLVDHVMSPGEQGPHDPVAMGTRVEQIAKREFAASMPFVDDPTGLDPTDQGQQVSRRCK